MIIVVDDQQPLLEITKKYLESEHIPHVAFDCPLQALSHITAHAEEVRLLITDFEMPGLDGSDLISLARAANPELPAIMVSGLPEAQVPLPANTRFLSKPFRPVELLAAVREYARQTVND